MPIPNAKKRVVIIGGGITGLSAAWTLQQAGIAYTVLEASARWGGKLQTEHHAGFTLEVGADAILTRKPWAWQLAQALRLSPQSVNMAQHKTYVLHGGVPMAYPEGWQLLAPADVWAFLRSSLFTWRGKLRLLADYLIPARRATTPPQDETLADFVRRRLGAEALDKAGEPLLAGVFNADPEQQSLLASFPNFAAMEQQHGSIMRGLWAARKQRATASAEGLPPFFSFESGAEGLIHGLTAQLTGDLRLESPVTMINGDATHGYTVQLTTGETVCADAVIVTVPASAASPLLRGIAPQAADALAAIPYTSVGAMFLAYPRDQISHPLNGFGVVIPGSERRRIDGMMWVSSKWTNRAPADHALIRVFFGGPRTADMMQLDDDALLPVIQGELRDILGITATPLFTRVYRWQDGYPLYTVGHLSRVAAIESALPAGVWVAGSSYRGIGVPDCVKQGQDAAAQGVALLAEK